MVNAPAGTILQHLCKWIGPETSDLNLLERFIAQGDEAAFAGLVQRFGGLVWGVCRRILHQNQDAEDAFQAVFLILARKAGSIRKGEAVGSWLYGVAFRTATKARKNEARRQVFEKQVPEKVSGQPPWTEAAFRELQQLLDEEMQRLPQKFRTPFILCCLEGMSKSEAAKNLGWKEGTVSGRLAQARKQLQQRLARRGVKLSAALTGVALAQNFAAAIPPTLIHATVRFVVSALAGKAASFAVPSILADQILHAMVMTKIKAGGILVLALSLLVAGARLAAFHFSPVSLPEGNQRIADGLPRKGVENGPPIQTKKASPGIQFQSAIKESFQAAEQIPDPFDQSRVLGRIAKTQALAGFKDPAKENFDRAFKVAETIGKDDPKKKHQRTEMQFFIAQMIAEAGDIPGAMKAVGKFEEGPGQFSFLSTVGRLYADAGDFDKAKDFSEKTFAVTGNSLLVTVAERKAQKGLWKEALKMAQDMDVESTKAEMFIALGSHLVKTGKKSEADGLFQKARKIIDKFPNGKGGSLQYLLASAWRDAGETMTALKIIKAIKVDSKYDIYYREEALATVYREAKQFSQALHHARKALEKMPSESSFWHIARTQAEAGDFKGAQATLDEMKMPGIKVYALMDIAKVRFQKGDKKKGLSMLKEAMELAKKAPEDRFPMAFFPGKAHIYYKLSLALTEAGEPDTARAWLARQISPHWQAWGYVGVAEGLLQKREKKKNKQ